MRRSTDRILTTHVGSLVRPPDLIEIMLARDGGQPYIQQELDNRVRSSIEKVVKRQVEVGVDVPSDGEYGKPNFAGYVNQRLDGFELRERNPNESPILNWGRDRRAFLEFYEEYDQATRNIEVFPVVCTGPISYVGQEPN